jgi:hypothetical protein
LVAHGSVNSIGFQGARPGAIASAEFGVVGGGQFDASPRVINLLSLILHFDAGGHLFDTVKRDRLIP